MGTLIYAPGIEVVIDTRSKGILDVSPDLEQGQLQIAESDVSTFQFSLVNHRRKYDGIFTPNDRISVRMYRLRWVQVFSGYLNAVPLFSTYAKSVPLSASDSLKRLQYTLWDAGTLEAFNLLNKIGGAAAEGEVDGGIADKCVQLLTTPELANWPKEKIHIGRIPDTWFNKVSGLYAQISGKINPTEALTTSPIMGGSGGLDGLGVGDTSGPRALPATSGKCSYYGTEATGATGITGERMRNPIDPWYCAMRFPYKSGAEKNWWKGEDGKGRRLVVFFPKTNKSVVVRAADWGPAAWTGRVIDLSPTAMQALGASTDQTVEIRFAPSSTQPTGPYSGGTAPAPAPGAVASPTPAAPAPGATNIQYNPGNTQGLSFQSGKNLNGVSAGAVSMVNFVHAASRGKFAYAISSAAAGRTKPHHSTGLAIDFGKAGRSDADMNALHDLLLPLAQGPDHQIQELFYSPRNTFLDNGVAISPDSGLRAGHYDHLHAAVRNANSFDPSKAGAIAGVGGAAPAPPSGKFLITEWGGSPDPLSQKLSGPIALMNDDPILNTVQVLMNASMRKFMAAPNGDFIAWFPDYFGIYKTAAKMRIEPIEIAGDGFTVMWSDARLVTHQYTAGSSSGHASTIGQQAVSARQMILTKGVASVEFPEIMEALFNIDKDDKERNWMLDPQQLFDRFGARKDFQPMGQIYGPEAEFWYALFLFQRNWANQFSSKIDLTFMPELWPGMLLNVPLYKFQAYIESVTHAFDFRNGGGGFQTQVSITAPSATDSGGLWLLPKGE